MIGLKSKKTVEARRLPTNKKQAMRKYNLTLLLLCLPGIIHLFLFN